MLSSRKSAGQNPLASPAELASLDKLARKKSPERYKIRCAGWPYEWFDSTSYRSYIRRLVFGDKPGSPPPTIEVLVKG